MKLKTSTALWEHVFKLFHSITILRDCNYIHISIISRRTLALGNFQFGLFDVDLKQAILLLILTRKDFIGSPMTALKHDL